MYQFVLETLLRRHSDFLAIWEFFDFFGKAVSVVENVGSENKYPHTVFNIIGVHATKYQLCCPTS